jgi:hypothetical protein
VSILFGGAQQPSNHAPKITGVQVQTSTNTLPNAIFAGTVKRAGNLIEYTDFAKHKVESGKGSLGGTTGFNYTASIILALGEGEIDDIPIVLVNQNEFKQLSDLFSTLIPGTWPDQSPWAYMVSAHPDDAFPYPGVIQVCKENYKLGASASVPNHQFLCVRTTGWHATWYSPSSIDATAYPALAAAFPSGIQTADMPPFIQNFLTSAQYGAQGFPASAIDTDSLLSSGAATTTGDAALQTYLRALGLGYCISIDSQESANSIGTRWMLLANFAAVWSGDKLKFIPYGTDEIDGNTVKYVPDLAPVCGTLDDNAFIGDSSADPVQLAITDPATAYNVIRIEITKDDGWFSNDICEVQSQNEIERAGGVRRVMPTVAAHEVLGQQAGQIIAELIRKKQLYDRNTVSFKVGVEYCLLEAMDAIPVFTKTFGLLNYRIESAEEDDNGDITITAKLLTGGTGSAHGNAVQQTGSGVPDAGTTPSPINPPLVFQPPTSLASPLQMWAPISGPDDNTYGGCDVYISLDDDDYEQIGTIDGSARTGYSTALLPAYGGANPDNTNTLSVDLSECGGELESLPSLASAEGRILCYIDGEIISFISATLTGPNQYDLTGLYRGLYGTSPGSHANGSRFARLDDKTFKYAVPEKYVGQTVYLKFASFNAYGQSTQDLSVATATTIAAAGIETPQNTYAGTVWSTLKTGAGAVNGLALYVQVDPPGDDNLIAQFQYRPPSGGRYRELPVARSEYGAISSILPESGDYSVRVRFVTQDLEQKSDWVTLMTTVPDPFVGVERSISVSTATFDVNNNDAYVGITNTHGAPIAANLPGSPAPNQTITFKDEGGNAGTYAITIGTVDGATQALTINYGWARIRWNGTTWNQV